MASLAEELPSMDEAPGFHSQHHFKKQVFNYSISPGQHSGAGSGCRSGGELDPKCVRAGEMTLVVQAQENWWADQVSFHTGLDPGL